MSKILLSNINSLWGVIINPNASNIYRHILSFDSPELKTSFISKYLFNDENYKDLLALQPEISLTQKTSLNAEFKVSITDYPNETFDSLLNKDFAIVLENGIEKFYTLVGERVGQIVKYTAELDIFFTYDVKNEIFNDKEFNVSRAMYDRFYVNSLRKWDYKIYEKYYDNPLFSAENFDGDIEKNLEPVSSKGENLTHDFEPYISSSILSDIRPYTRGVNKAVQRTRWNLIFRKAGTDINESFWDYNDYGGDSESSFFLKNHPESKFPYIATVIPNSATWYDDDTRTTYHVRYWGQIIDPRYPGDDLHPMDVLDIKNPNTMKNTYTILPFDPFNEDIKNVKIDIYEKTINDDGSVYIGVKFIFLESNNGDLGSGLLGRWRTYKTPPPIAIERNAYNIAVTNSKQTDYYFKTSMSPLPNKDFINSLTINSPLNLENEIKTLGNPYRKFTILSPSKNQYDLNPFLFLKNTPIEYKRSFLYIPELWGYYMQFKNYNKILTSNEPDDMTTQLNWHFEDYANYSLPTETDKYEEFLIRNKSQINNNLLSKKTNLGLGVLTSAVGIAGTVLTGGVTAIASAGAIIGGITNAVKASNSIKQDLAMLADLKRTPNTIEGIGSTGIADFAIKNINPSILEFRLPLQMRNRIQTFFYQHGYNWNNRLENWNNIFNKRYYFEYFELNGIFENIKLQAAADVKQLINDTFEKGITIWHVRDLTTFKGIKNYKYENLEMVLVNK